MGAVIAAKIPLSLRALQSLHRNTQHFRIDRISARLGSLLSGCMDEKQLEPVQIIHQSLRDFITKRARNVPDRKKSYIREKDHNQRLAILCLNLLNEDLIPGVPGVGYLDDDGPGVPVVKEGISEELEYAAKYHIRHICEIDRPKPPLVELLRRFLSTQLISWMELVTSIDRFCSLGGLKRWMEVS